MRKQKGMYLKNSILIILFSISIVVFSQNSNTDGPPVSGKYNGKIAVLGTFHFGSTSDVAAVKIDNLMGPQRQEEIQSMLDKIRDYQPTKVLLEVEREKQDRLQTSYQNYLTGKYELEKSEIYQLGFRLAKMMGHDSVYAIDYKLPLPFGQIEDFARDHEMLERFESFVKDIRAYAEVKSKYLKNHTLTNYFAQMNSDSADRWNRSLYLQETLDYNSDTLYTGPRISALYFERNLYITANVMRHSGPEERLLLIIGSGHRAIMKHFFETRFDIDYVEINQYLKP